MNTSRLRLIAVLSLCLLASIGSPYAVSGAHIRAIDSCRIAPSVVRGSQRQFSSVPTTAYSAMMLLDPLNASITPLDHAEMQAFNTGNTTCVADRMVGAVRSHIPLVLPSFHGPLAVVVSNPNPRNAYIYTTSLIDTKAQVVMSVHSRDTRFVALGNNTDTPFLSPVSASAVHLFYIEGQTTIRELGADGSTRVVTHIPGSSHTRSAFAVSPDERQIAVAVMDFSPAPHAVSPEGGPFPFPVFGPPVRERLYIEDLHGGHHHEIFSATAGGYEADLVWPIGWIAGALVLAVGPEGSQQGNANPYSAWFGYHVVNAHTGIRLANVCGGSHPTGGSGWWATGSVGPAGTVCTKLGTANEVYAQDWQGRCALFPLSRADYSTVLSPDGAWIASLDKNFNLLLASRNGRRVPLNLSEVQPLGWLDAHHFLATGGGYGSSLPSGIYVFAVPTVGSITHVRLSTMIAGISPIDGFQGVLPGGLGRNEPQGPPGTGACSH